MYGHDQRLNDGDTETGIALSILFRISWKLLCCPICLMIWVTESEWNQYFQLDAGDSERTEDDANEREYDKL